jgi:hypothetical protein
VALEDPSLILPFNMERLSITFDTDVPIPPSQPLATLCQPSIHHLCLVCGPACAPILHNFLPLTHQLRTLTLARSADQSFLPTYLQACRSLQHLKISNVEQACLKALPSPLVTLSLRHFTPEDAGALFEFIEDGAVGVSKLQRLEVRVLNSHGLPSGLPENATEEGTIWRDLAMICWEKGIMIEGTGDT